MQSARTSNRDGGAGADGGCVSLGPLASKSEISELHSLHFCRARVVDLRAESPPRPRRGDHALPGRGARGDVPVPADLPGAVRVHARAQALARRARPLDARDADRHGQDHHAALADHVRTSARTRRWASWVYCTRTIPEMEKVLEELKVLEAHRDELDAPARRAALLAARAELAAQFVRARARIDARRAQRRRPGVPADDGELGAPARARHRRRRRVRRRRRRVGRRRRRRRRRDGDGRRRRHRAVQLLREAREGGTDAALQPGVYTLEELKRLGRSKGGARTSSRVT